MEHRLARAKSEWDGEVKKKVDEDPTVRAAEVKYEFDAKRRLYEAIGPLRFQLLLACRDLANRIRDYGMWGQQYSLDPTTPGYYGLDTLFRLIRPLALAELIERQMTYADFAIDRDAVGLLRFRDAATEAFSGTNVILNHPDANWSDAIEHLFRNTVPYVAGAMIVKETDRIDRVLRYEELDDVLKNRSRMQQLAPLVRILKDFDIDNKPRFWLRLVCYGYICAEFVNQYGTVLGFAKIEYAVGPLIQQTRDSYILDNLDQFETVFAKLADAKL